MLELRGLTKRFGGLFAVQDVDLTVPTGELHVIIGPNGAGKTTLLSVLTGDERPTSGRIWLDGVQTDRLQPHQIARLGMLRKFQVPGIFSELSVWDNLAIAAQGRTSLLRLFRDRTRHDTLIEQTMERLRLTDHAHTPAGELSHGNVQWLEIAMVLIDRPRVLLLDEPTAGMTRAETLETAALLGAIAKETAATMIIVEHDMEFVRLVGHRITVMHKGIVLAQGEIDDIEKDPQVREVYLGTEASGDTGAP